MRFWKNDEEERTLPTVNCVDELVEGEDRLQSNKAIKKMTKPSKMAAFVLLTLLAGSAVTVAYGNAQEYDLDQGLAAEFAGQPEQAIKWYRKAAELGRTRAQFQLGFMYEHGIGVLKDFEQAAFWYGKAAVQGDAEAEANLGWMYERGKGTGRDLKQAASWYRKAAEQGNAIGEFYLGLLYENGKGLPKNFTEAFSWYAKAANQGVALAQSRLGSIYEDGKGVSQDYIEAYKWFRIAGQYGDAAAIKKRLDVAQRLSPGQIDKAKKRATKWILDFELMQQDEGSDAAGQAATLN